MTASQLDSLYAAFVAADEQTKEATKETLLLAMYNDCWPIMRSILGTVHPDLVADAVSKAALSLDKFRGEARFSSWFYKIVESFCKTRIRQKIRRNETSLDEMIELDQEPVGEDRHLRDEARLDLNRIMQDLAPIDQQILQLRSEGRTMKDVAGVVGLSTRGVNSRWRRLKERLGLGKKAPDKSSASTAGSV